MVKGWKTGCTLGVILSLVCSLFACSGVSTPSDERSDNVQLPVIENIKELELTIYYIEPEILTRKALTIDELTSFPTVSTIHVKGDELLQIEQVLNTLSPDMFSPADDTNSQNVRLYYRIQTDHGERLFDVALGGNNQHVFMNGIEVAYHDVFYDIIKPYLTDEEQELLAPYFDGRWFGAFA